MRSGGRICGRLNAVKPTSSGERSESDGVAVEFVVAVAVVGHEVGEEFLEVFAESRLVLVDEHARGGVANEDVAGTGVDVLGDAAGDAIGDCDRLEPGVGGDGQRPARSRPWPARHFNAPSGEMTASRARSMPQ